MIRKALSVITVYWRKLAWEENTPDLPQDVNYIQIVTQLTIYTRH